MFIPLHDTNTLKHIKLQFVTLGLIAVNIFIWLITATPAVMNAEQANVVFYSYGFVPAVVNDLVVLPADFTSIPEPASYVTYAFLHADFMHVAGNMLFLWVFGDNVEDAMGHIKFLAFYLLCAAAGALAHKLAVPGSEAPLIGASGAAAGVIAAYLLLHPRVRIWVLAFGRIPLKLSAMWVIGAWIAFQLFNFFAVADSQVSWAAHLGGILAGGVLVLFMRRSGVQLFDANLPVRPSAIPASGTRDRSSVRKSGKPAAGQDRIWGRRSDED